MPKHIHIIRPASREAQDLLGARIPELTQLADRLIYNDFPSDHQWPYTSGSVEQRLDQLNNALFDCDCTYIWSARGGYGCSDLLDLLDWKALKALNHAPKIIGFSDISALHSAFYSKLGWRGIHAPMPATTLWKQDGVESDIDLVTAGIRSDQWQGTIKLTELITSEDRSIVGPLEGSLFGGCFSVLTNLIGTEFFPKNLIDHIVFLEDTSEHPGRLQRYLNQWIHSGVLRGTKAIVLGDFRDCCSHEDFCRFVAQPFAQKTGVPVFTTREFGHTSPNSPMMIGAKAKIDPAQLNLEWTEEPDGRLST